MANTVYSLTQLYAVVEGKIPENDAISRQILVALLALKAFNPNSALTLRSIAKAIGAHPQQVKRKVTGDRHCYSRLKGLVRWESGKGRKGTRVWLSAEGKAAAIALLASVTFPQRPSSSLFEDPQKWLQVLALFATDQKPQPNRSAKNVTPTLKNMFRPSVSFKDEDLKVRRESEFKTFVKATTAIFNQPLGRNDFGFRCKVGKTLLAEFPLDAAIGIIRHAQRAWSNATPAQVLRFALKHKEALFEAHLRECERRENLKRIRAVMRPFVAPNEKPKQPPTSPPIKGDRAERAAEIVAADQPLQPIAQRRGKKRCPRCGAEGFELVLKRFDRYYPEIPCPEPDRFNGVEVCGYCLKVLRIDEMKAVLAAKSNLQAAEDAPAD
ncbi:MAG: hypothetical protein ACO2PL_09400 [Armatimonadota bacterium]|jgi:hypothetical protein